ncbi:MAG: hypothetical protein BMS9Abin23_1011 [Thermodesulfobacteriota bacterium]|nr:MAG: hypothetical protein BMS9Abin23_1011 [Thermodesulfobacteriota bacterium]
MRRRAAPLSESRVTESTGGVIIDFMPVPALVVSFDGRITAVNRPLLDLLHYREGAVVGMPLEAIFHDGAEFRGIFENRILKGDAVKEIEATLVSSDGVKVHTCLSARILKDNFNCQSACVLAFRDTTRCQNVINELNRTREELSKRVNYLEEFRSGVFEMLRNIDRSEQELERTCKKLKETQSQLIQTSKLKALGELSATIAHELKQPLTVIRGLAQNLLKNSQTQTPEYEKAKLILNASKNMEAIIKHLGVFSRTGEEELKPVDLNKVIKGAFIILRKLLERSSIELRLDLKKIPPVAGSANRLEQVIINLVTNAKDAMAAGGSVEISTRAVTKNNATFVELVVRDSGAGMTPEVLEKAFDPFFTTKEEGKGTGLGLSISYGIIKEHKGEITAESAPGKGSVFRITLPALNEDERTGPKQGNVVNAQGR